MIEPPRAAPRALGSVPLVVLALLTAAALACSRKSPPPPATALALVAERQGNVEIEKSGVWKAAAPGDSLSIGDALRTGPDSSARLRFAVGQEVALHERSLLRVGTDADSSVHISIELGEAEVEGDGQLQVDTAQGPARLSAGTRLRVKVDAEGARYEVVIGRAVFGEGATALALGAGDGMRLRVGDAQVERYRIEVGAAEVEETTPDAGVAPRATGEGAAGEPSGGKPGTATGPRPPSGPVDVSLPAGESAIIHGPHTPVAIRLRLGVPCPVAATLSMEGNGPRRKQPLATSEARLSLAPGTHRYRIECPGSPPVDGRLEVKRDSGRSRLARRAPMNMIEADGRRYTVLYQNRLPSLTFKWPGAPSRGPYTLNVTSGGGGGSNKEPRAYPAPGPELHLASGALTDGPHSLWFTADGGKLSPRTAVTIRFDNAAVTAEIDSPRNGTLVGGDTAVEIAGVALQGSTVAVGAAPLAIDDQGRFKGQVPPPSGDERSIAIRLQHPRGGVHYYIRRIAGK